MLTLVVVLKALAEVAGLALLGQGILFLLAGARRERPLTLTLGDTLPAGRVVVQTARAG